MKRNILVIGADESKYEILSRYLVDLNYLSENIYSYATVADALHVAAGHVDIILADLSLHANSLSALCTLQSHFINQPVILLLQDEATTQTVQGQLIYGSYNAAHVATAIANAREQKAIAATLHNKELLAQVKEQKDHLESILFSINDAIWSRNADTMELTYANNAYHKLYGYTDGDLVKNIRYDSIHIDDREKFFAAIDDVRATGTMEVTYRYTHQDGNLKTLKATAMLKKGAENKPDIISGVTIDITREKELHETIRNTEQKLLATINNTKDLIWSVNKDLEIIFCNKPYKDFIYSLGGIIPQEGNFVLGDWGSESFINSRKKDYERALTGESFTTIVEEVYKDELMYNEISSSPIIDHDGNIIGVNCIARDISQQKKQFFKIREQNEKLRDIAWIQSHKVRGPVSSILGLASLLDYESATNEHTVDIIKKLIIVTNDLDKIIKEVVDTTFDIDYTYTDADFISSQG